MESILIAFVVITVMLFAGTTLFEDYMAAEDMLRTSWQEMEERYEEQTRTTLTLVNVETKSSGAVVEITLQNDGSVKLYDFDEWDFIVQYYSAPSDYEIGYLPYLDSEPVNNEWTVVGIYSDTVSLVDEVYEPGILNPGEEILLRARVVPSVDTGTTNMATISTDKAVTLSVIFSR